MPDKAFDVEALREKYPDPTTFDEQQMDGNYCVGGTLCLEMEEQDFFRFGPEYKANFPDQVMLADALEAANPALLEPGVNGERVADHYAEEIISANDEDEDFERAWAVLNEALSYE